MSDSDVKNYYKTIPDKFITKVENPNFYLTHINLPFRMAIVSASGGGKTNFLCDLIHKWCMNKGTFATITIITRNKDEPLYVWLQTLSDSIVVKEGLSSTPVLDKMDKTINNLVVWDDLVLEKDLTRISEFFVRARKLNVSCIFISQSYFGIPPIIRKNINYLVLLKLQGKRDLNAILSECGLGVDKKTLIKIYNYATSVSLTPLFVDLDIEPSQRFRRGLKEVLDIKEFE